MWKKLFSRFNVCHIFFHWDPNKREKSETCKIKFQVSQSIIRYRAFNVLEASNKLLCEGFEIYSFSSEIIKTDFVSWRWPSTIFTLVKWSGLEVLNSGGISGACVLESDRNAESNPQSGVADVLIWDQPAGSDSLNPLQSSRHIDQNMKDCKSWYSGLEIHSLPLHESVLQPLSHLQIRSLIIF